MKVTIEGIDEDDDLEEESNKFDLGVQDDKTVTLKFELPLNVDDDTFDVIIEAEGEDENGTVHQQHFEIELEVEKEKHDLRFLSFDLSPLIVSCIRIISLDYKIINVGQEDEENSILEIKNDDLNLDYIQNFSVDSGTEDNTFFNSIKLKIENNVENEIYPIIANVYSDNGKLQDTKTKEMKVEDCLKIKEEEAVLLITSKQFEQPKIAATKEQIQAPTIEVSFKESDRNMQLLIFSTLIFTIFFVFIAIVLYTRF